MRHLTAELTGAPCGADKRGLPAGVRLNDGLGLVAEAKGQTMTAVRITYLIVDLVLYVVFLALAVAAPIWITPGQYWWTAFSIFLLFSQGCAFTKRLNSWGCMGEV